MKKRVLSILMAALLCLSLLPAGALAEGGAGAYGLWLGGVAVTDENKADILGDGTAAYNSAANTLTLTDCVLNGRGYSGSVLYYGGSGALKIVLEGQNDLIGGAGQPYALSAGGSAQGIVFTGGGVLVLSGGSGSEASPAALSAPALTLDASFTGTLIATGGAASDASAGIRVQDGMTVNNGVVIATGGTAASSYGVDGSFTVTGRAAVVARAGLSTDSGTRKAVSGTYTAENGVTEPENQDPNATAMAALGSYWKDKEYKSGQTITDKKITGDAYTISAGSNWNAALYYGESTLDLNGKTLLCFNLKDIETSDATEFKYSTADGLDTYSYLGISDSSEEETGRLVVVAGAKHGASSVNAIGIDVNGQFSLSGGSVIAVGGITFAEGNAAGDSYGLFDLYDVPITGGSLTAVGGAGRSSAGIFLDKLPLTTISTGSVNAIGGTNSQNSYGIFSNNNYQPYNEENKGIEISDGRLTAAGAQASGGESIGILCKYAWQGYGDNKKAIGGSIAVTGGAVNASGGNVGLACDKSVTVSGGSVVASGGQAESGYGIRAGDDVNSKIAISGGTVEARKSAASDTALALSKAPDITNNTAWISASADGSSPVPYPSETLTNYKWFKSAPLEDYNLWVAGVQVSNTNAADLSAIEGVRVAEGGSARYDAASKTLTLSGATITCLGSGTEDAGYYGIYFASGAVTDEPLKIIVKGKNTVIPAQQAVAHDTGAICAADKAVIITLNAGSELTVTGGPAAEGFGSFGVVTPRDITVSGRGTLNAGGGAACDSAGLCSTGGTVTVSGNPKVNATGGQASGTSYGIRGNAISLSGGVVTAKTVSAAGTAQALNTAPTLTNVIARADTAADGSNARNYDPDNLSTYKWFRTIAKEDYPVWVGGVRVNNENAEDLSVISGVTVADGGSARYTPASGDTPATLTLNNAEIQGAYYSSTIYTTEPLVIDLAGTNSLKEDNSASFGVWASGSDLTVTGSGRLTATGKESGLRANHLAVTGGTVEVTGKSNAGIFTERSVTVSGENTVVTASGPQDGISSAGSGYNGAVAISGGTVTATSNGRSGIYAGGVTVSGGTVNASGSGYGIYAADKFIRISGSDTKVDAAGSSNGLFGTAGVEISGGTVTGTSGTGGYGLYATRNPLSITGGTVTAIAEGGGYGLYASSKLIISGSSTRVDITGNENGLQGTAGIEISGGSVTAASKTGNYAFASMGPLSITGGTVTAKAESGCGLYVTDDFLISGSSTAVNASGPQAAVCAKKNPTVSDPLKIVKPEGGSFQSRTARPEGSSYYIVTADGEIAADAAIKAPSSGGGGGGGGGSASYKVSLPAAPENGAVTVSPASAAQGKTVTISPAADEGYQVGTVKVTDKDGKEIPVTDNGDGTYSFIMPASAVDVAVDFVPVEPAPPADDERFADVDKDDYYHDAVYWAVDQGITQGVDDTHFAPAGPCTRAQMVTFLWRAAGEPSPASAENPFADVSSGAYYYSAVLWAVERGITQGTDGTHFSPGAVVDRAQSVTFLYRFTGEKTEGDNPFTDVSQDAYYYDAVLWAAAEGVTAGVTATTFAPNDACTRGQVVTFLYRAMG